MNQMFPHKSCSFLKGLTGVTSELALLLLSLLLLDETGIGFFSAGVVVIPSGVEIETPQSGHKGSNPRPAIPLLGVLIVIGGAGVVTLIRPLLLSLLLLVLTFSVFGLLGLPPMNWWWLL